MIQLELFPRTLSKTKLPTNLTTNYYPIHRWFNFIAGFSPEFVRSCVREARLTSDDVLIDPFGGLSTSLVQANFEGIRSIGFEPHPFFFDLSQAKIAPPTDVAAIDEIEVRLLGLRPYTYPAKSDTDVYADLWSTSAIKFLKKLIPEQELRFLASALLLERDIDSSVRQPYRLIVSRVLELTSKSQTDGIYKAPTTKKRTTPFREAVKRVCQEVRQDIKATVEIYKRQATLYPTSSEKMSPIEDESCSICVTSPPYLNNFDFAEMTRMELYFWRYANSWGEITEKVRRHQIVNTTTAPTEFKKNYLKFKGTLSKPIQMLLEPIVEALEKEKRVRAGKKDYYRLVYPYFSQMQSVFRELRRVLKGGSPFHLVVADSALYGVHIDTQKILARLMEETGFEVLEIELLRKRGGRWILKKRQGSKKGLGEYHIVSRRL